MPPYTHKLVLAEAVPSKLRMRHANLCTTSVDGASVICSKMSPTPFLHPALPPCFCYWVYSGNIQLALHSLSCFLLLILRSDNLPQPFRPLFERGESRSDLYRLFSRKRTTFSDIHSRRMV